MWTLRLKVLLSLVMNKSALVVVEAVLETTKRPDLKYIKLPWGPVKNAVSDSVFLGWDLRFFISNKFSGDDEDAGPWTTLSSSLAWFRHVVLFPAFRELFLRLWSQITELDSWWRQIKTQYKRHTIGLRFQELLTWTPCWLLINHEDPLPFVPDSRLLNQLVLSLEKQIWSSHLSAPSHVLNCWQWTVGHLPCL